ncbi:biotin/lipoyl-containing protein [Acidaminobacter hydrogenoformans]|uniref:Glutaconyl-CoA decarboxylase n=1 Tax=Acidaminobacter hydrogenoformans DSM 2784 TaxID=1120920 RepID=A0A1G5RQ55_9FIRM|nr:biotin/lipoyl-containing protein [Acidaminobacter hydrogenoformans]SCZ75980.1 glutaconyl-CoA decarboxylase [Acidaminobacter hydrogenoformans DSM 2784]
MRKFNITVNGKAYEVEVEEIGGAMPAMPARPAAAPKAAPAPAPTPAPAAAAAAPAPAAAPAAAPVAGGSTVSAPMPGTVLDIKVAVGDTVQTNDVLMILEAMKMENEIMAPVAGKVAQISVSKGASVNSGDVMIVIA